jgi:Cysteine-rich secretory protein family/S-layer homology domain
MALTAVFAPSATQPVAARDGDVFVSEVNRYRADAGVPPVSLHSKIDQIAVERATHLARAQELSHNMDYIKKRLDQENICWERLGEIVAYNGLSAEKRVQHFVSQWYNSDGHRKVMLGSGYTHAGGSYTTADNGYHYAAMIFVDICGATAQPVTYGGFTDIADSKFRDDIVWLAGEGITTGCSDTRFCPTRLVYRDQMATFLTRAMGLPAASKDHFKDDDGNTHQDRINRIADAKVTRGCDTRRFCPGNEVTRGQMASFIARALALPSTSRDYFTDDDWSAHEDAINRMAAAGITYGCGEKRFCPRVSVNREQMAAFLRRAYD